MILQTAQKWYDMMLSGERTEDYREITPYYDIRFKNLRERRAHDTGVYLIDFRNGCCRTAPFFTAECTIHKGFGKEEWGAIPGVEYYVLTVKKILWSMGTVAEFLEKSIKVFESRIPGMDERVRGLREICQRNETEHGVQGMDVQDKRRWERYVAAQIERECNLARLQMAEDTLSLIRWYENARVFLTDKNRSGG